jgi:peroxiredoxin/mono/diheme cytochrome c family protein
MRLLSTSLLLAATFVLVGAAQGDQATSTKIDDFTLHDHLGAKHSFGEWRDKKAVVVVFLGTECPLAKLYGRRLAEIAAVYEPRGVQFVGIDSNVQDTLQKIGQYVRVHKIEFPVLKDPAHEVADRFGATRTPEAFVLNGEGQILYRGRIDDEYGIGFRRQNEVNHNLTNALDEILAGNAVTTSRTEPIGCLIGRAKQKAPTGDVTYNNQVVRLVDAHCVRCHRPGQIAPFSLTSYDDVAAWAETMCEVMDDGRMPPWHANPDYGKFANDAHMPAADKQLFRQWVDNGMPAGDPADLPEPTVFNEGWQITEPDLIVRMPQTFTVPAKGTVDYQYFYVDKPLERDTWIRGAEVRPTNPAVVHHVLMFYLPPGQAEPHAEDPLFNAIASFAPGMPAGLWPEGYARFVPAGSRIVFQMHYTPNGSEQIDQTEVGIVFADPAVEQKEVKIAIAVNTDFEIPPGAANFHVPAGHEFQKDMLLYSLMPHMHYRGKSFRFTARYPDGSSEILLDVPRYDFNWQNVYTFEEPKRMPKGTVVFCDGHFDNSAENPANPDPAQVVRWGDQTWEEMMLGVLVVSLPDDVERGEYPKVEPVDKTQYDVTFRLRPNDVPANIRDVFLAGSFNGWQEQAQRMERTADDGCYYATIRLKAGQYEYKFIVNGKAWLVDPENPDIAGAYSNSVIRIQQPTAN